MSPPQVEGAAPEGIRRRLQLPGRPRARHPGATARGTDREGRGGAALAATPGPSPAGPALDDAGSIRFPRPPHLHGHKTSAHGPAEDGSPPLWPPTPLCAAVMAQACERHGARRPPRSPRPAARGVTCDCWPARRRSSEPDRPGCRRPVSAGGDAPGRPTGEPRCGDGPRDGEAAPGHGGGRRRCGDAERSGGGGDRRGGDAPPRPGQGCGGPRVRRSGDVTGCKGRDGGPRVRRSGDSPAGRGNTPCAPLQTSVQSGSGIESLRRH